MVQILWQIIKINKWLNLNKSVEAWVIKINRWLNLNKSIEEWLINWLIWNIEMVQISGSGGIEKSHSCKWAKWIQRHALPHIPQST